MKASPTLPLLLTLLLAPLAAVHGAAAEGATTPPILTTEELAFVREVATATLNNCEVAPGAVAKGKTNTLGFRAITPGGYPAIWIQDFTMNFSSGLIAREDGLRHLQLILEQQNGPTPIDLGRQVIIPAHAIADHINVDGTPVFFPGTYDPSAHMNGDWGFRPPSNNQFDVIWLAHMLAHTGDAKALLSREVGGRTVYERLKLAFAVPEIDPATQLVRTTAARRAVGFIFYDAIEMTGDLLMASLIRYRAALQLAWLATKMDQPEDAKHYAGVAQQIRSHILPVFADTDGTHGGWLKASNGISGQSDVWGSIYAIHIGAVEGEARAGLLRTITAALAKPGEIEFEGALRHVPLSGDASPTTMWEKTRVTKNRYENGAYWHIPIGWLLTILQPGHPELAQTVKRHWLGHLRAQQGKVWECIGWDGRANKNPSYVTSIALPLGVLSRGELRVDRLPSPLAAVRAAEPVVIDLNQRTWQGIPGLERTAKGRVYVCWFTGGPKEPSADNTVVLSYSDDAGKTFTSPEAMALPTNDGTRCFDPTLWIDPKGRLWYVFNRGNKDLPRHDVWARICAEPDAPKPAFGPEFRVGFDAPYAFRMNKPTVLSGGEWIMPVTHAQTPIRDWFAEWRQLQGVGISTTEGLTWKLHGALRAPEWALECMVTELKDGRLWMLIRTGGGFLWESYSKDKGLNWSDAKASRIKNPGSRFFIRRLSSGNLLLVNHYKNSNRSHLTAQLSTDDGVSWNEGLLLDERGGVSYPDGVQDKDGLIWITYDRDRGGAGEILLAKFREEDVIAGKDVSGAVTLKQTVDKLNKPTVPKAKPVSK